MKRFFQILFEVTADILRNAVYFIKNNLVTFANLLNIILPFMMYVLGLYDNNSATLKGFIPIIFFLVIYYIKSMANKLGKGMTIPLPDKRFTEVDDEGEVTIENKRLQELLLYTADLEDWLERKGLL